MNNFLNGLVLKSETGYGQNLYLSDFEEGFYILFRTRSFVAIDEVLNFKNWKYRTGEIMKGRDFTYEPVYYIFEKKYKPDFNRIFSLLDDNKKTIQISKFTMNKSSISSDSLLLSGNGFTDFARLYEEFAQIPGVEILKVETDNGSRGPLFPGATQLKIVSIYSTKKLLSSAKAKSYDDGSVISRTEFERFGAEQNGRGNMEEFGKRIRVRDHSRGVTVLKAVEKYADPKVLDRRVNKYGTDMCGSSAKGILNDGTKECGLCHCSGHSRNNDACPSCGAINSHTCMTCPILNSQYKACIREGKPELCSCSIRWVCENCKSTTPYSFMLQVSDQKVKILGLGRDQNIVKEVMANKGKIITAKNLFYFFFDTRQSGIEGLFPNKFITDEIRSDLKALFDRDGRSEISFANFYTWDPKNNRDAAEILLDAVNITAPSATSGKPVGATRKIEGNQLPNMFNRNQSPIKQNETNRSKSPVKQEHTQIMSSTNRSKSPVNQNETNRSKSPVNQNKSQVTVQPNIIYEVPAKIPTFKEWLEQEAQKKKQNNTRKK